MICWHVCSAVKELFNCGFLWTGFWHIAVLMSCEYDQMIRRLRSRETSHYSRHPLLAVCTAKLSSVGVGLRCAIVLLHYHILCFAKDPSEHTGFILLNKLFQSTFSFTVMWFFWSKNIIKNLSRNIIQNDINKIKM